VYSSEEERSIAGKILLEKADTVQGVLGREISWNTASRAFQEAFSEVLQLNLVEDSFTTEEIESARNLAENQFGASDWTRGAHIKPNL
jgi:lipoate-protein ligase A